MTEVHSNVNSTILKNTVAPLISKKNLANIKSKREHKELNVLKIPTLKAANRNSINSITKIRQTCFDYSFMGTIQLYTFRFRSLCNWLRFLGKLNFIIWRSPGPYQCNKKRLLTPPWTPISNRFSPKIIETLLPVKWT